MPVLAISLILAQGFAPPALAADSTARFGAHTRDEFRADLAVHPYEPAGARTSKIIAGAQKLARCMTYADVRRLMGEPNFGNSTHRSGEASDKSAGVAWTYILSPVRKTVDPYDKMITIWLDEHGRVTSVHPLGVDAVLPLRAHNKQECP
jgi:hypothetical protein